MRKVTEEDFRKDQYRNAKVEDYEFRSDGKLVRKDRWFVAVDRIACMMGCINRGEFEIDEVVDAVQSMRNGESKKDKNSLIWSLLRIHFCRGDESLYQTSKEKNEILESVFLEEDISLDDFMSFRNHQDHDYGIEWLGEKMLDEAQGLFDE